MQLAMSYCLQRQQNDSMAGLLGGGDDSKKLGLAEKLSAGTVGNVFDTHPVSLSLSLLHCIHTTYLH